MADVGQASIPQELIEQIARGNCVLLLGPDADARGRLDALAQALAAECDYPPEKADRSLPAVARYYQALMGRHQLVVRLREWLERDGSRPAALHHAAARLPLDRIVDFGYDSRLKEALREAGRPCTPVVSDLELRYADRSKVLLVKPYGTADQPNSLVLTEDDHYLFEKNHPLLAEQLRIWAATQVLLWLGVDMTDFHWQRLHENMTEDINPRHRREYALVESFGEVEAWIKCGVMALVPLDPAAWLVELTQAVDELPPLPADTLPGPGPLLGRRPYKFLDFYTAEDADLFFGREQRAEDLVARILAQPLVVLFGRSGVGKTSLLLAGVIPRLKERDCWPIYARPGEDPLAAVRTAAEVGLSEPDRVAGKTPVVILDQAEECFTALSRPVRERWVAALARVLRDAAGDVRWVLSLREDFAAELHEWTTQVPTLFDHTSRLTPLSRDDAREAIARPPERVGAVIEDALVERLLDDLTIEGVDPAQLQIVCDRLYQARDEAGRMTLDAYVDLGGKWGILAEYVDFTLAQLPRQQRELAVALLKAMVTGRETKLPLHPEEVLGSVEGDPAEKQAVLSGLVDVRLVRSLEIGSERRYELAHEVLVEKVRSWIDETERQAKAARDLLRQERTAWERLQVLPEREKVAYLHAQRENPYLPLDAQELELMLRAALHQGLAPGYWTQRAAEAGLEVWPLLAPALESGQEGERIPALWALTGWPVPQALEALQAGLAAPSPRVRVAAHQALYQVGSPQALAILDTSDDLRLVPAGEFTMGAKGGDEHFGDEKPVHQVTLEALFVENHPVTNKNCARFIEAGGYEDEQYWTQAGWRWARRVKRAQPAFWQDEKWNQPEYAVVGVTWYEAQAYAQWAGRRLLNEAEWEKAARGTDGREYPWGEGFDQNRCNTFQSALGRTTPVGHYSPQGDSPYGLTDMAGNVWEWTSSLYRPYPYRAGDGREDPDAPGNRVLRGGSWSLNEDHARCAARHFNPPGNALCASRSSQSDAVPYDPCGCRCGVAVVSRSFSPLVLDAGNH